MCTQCAPVCMGLILLISTTGYSEESTAHRGSRATYSFLQLITEKLWHTKEQQAEDRDNLPYNYNKHYPVHTKGVDDYRSYSNHHILEVFPRDLRQKEHFLKHLTGPLYFSPKCSKHFSRLYHSTRDCTVPAYYKRCARLLKRLAGSPRCMEG